VRNESKLNSSIGNIFEIEVWHYLPALVLRMSVFVGTRKMVNYA